jgi:serine phosphatase RsbU (regulator of sigma subunit)
LLIAAGLAIRVVNYLVGLVAPLPSGVSSVVDITGTVAIAAGAGFFLVRAVASLKRRLLWRVRRKLIISYIFVGFVPVMLVAAFFVLAGVLLFFNVSAYLVRSEFIALRARARIAAHDISVEIERSHASDAAAVLQRARESLASEFPGASLALVTADRRCTGTSTIDEFMTHRPTSVAGPWAHVLPPTSIPTWIGCEAFGGLFVFGDAAAPSASNSGLVIRGVGFPESSAPPYAVVIDLVIDRSLSQRIREATGAAPVAVGQLDSAIGLLQARAPAEARTPFFEGSLPLPSFCLPQYHDWNTGRSGLMTTNIRLSIPEIYQKMTATPGSGTGGGDGFVLLALQVVGVLFLVIEGFALLAGLTLARSITGSVHELFTGTERVRRGDFSHKIASTANDQLGELAQSFNSMTASIEDLLEQAAQKKRLEEELRIAHEIQMSLLPQGRLRMPGISVTALCVPAREVGGDYYDFLPIDDHRLGILIADVSGKGTSAALYMAELKGLVLSLSRIHTSPRDLLVEANRIIARHLDARSFITMTYAVIDLKARTMTYARAGHTPLMLLPAAAGERRERARVLVPGGMVLGLKLDQGEMFERLLEQDVVSLRTGDLYLFFTDGITEAMNAHDDCFGEMRLSRLLEEHGDLPPEELRERVLREIEGFVGEAPQHDDMTLILLRVEDLENLSPADPVPVVDVAAMESA